MPVSCDKVFDVHPYDVNIKGEKNVNAKPSEPNEMTLLRLCDVHNIPLATNIATAEVLIHGLERGDLDWRDIVHPQNG